ncbi:hypothetical protein TSUD_25350 [Trifolium subterraneum]|uniref:RNase H type-1 domain-containing protein n=1 Tax=Trifolium subterraneum TaxID=3900 RepID=A0A2Z6P039_TRISU|nr:hypothetical protein TSUD_25350 [Trifolium subterraneum]
MNWNNLWLESDSEMVVQAFKNINFMVAWNLRNRWHNVKILLSRMNCIVSHIYKEGNQVADTLVNYGCSLSSFTYWHYVPDFIKDSFDINRLGEEEDLSEAELEDLHGITSDIHSLSCRNASIWKCHFFDTDGWRNYIRSETYLSTCVFHFASHFKASIVDRPWVDNLQFRRLTPLDDDSLTKFFSVEEIKTAVWDYDSYKSSGPDEINFGFIRDFWLKMQADIMHFIAEFHRIGKLSKDLNSTFIALILKLVIGSVIFESQTAFVKERQILILIANEVVDEAHKTKKELMLFKVDFEKTYDSVD